jgi:hypothetical protein
MNSVRSVQRGAARLNGLWTCSPSVVGFGEPRSAAFSDKNQRAFHATFINFAYNGEYLDNLPNIHELIVTFGHPFP